MLTYLEQNSHHIMDRLSKEVFVKEFSEIVMHLIKVEQSIVVDTINLINTMKIYHEIFTKYNQLVPCHLHTAYFKTLSKYYEEVGESRKARMCHEEIVRKGLNLEGCNPGECNNNKIAEAYQLLGDYETSLRFYEMEYDSTTDIRSNFNCIIQCSFLEK